MRVTIAKGRYARDDLEMRHARGDLERRYAHDAALDKDGQAGRRTRDVGMHG